MSDTYHANCLLVAARTLLAALTMDRMDTEDWPDDSLAALQGLVAAVAFYEKAKKETL